MVRKIILVLITWAAIVGVIYGSSHSVAAKEIFTWLLRIGFLSLIVGGSIYKLSLWWRYRHDPEARESIVFSTQLFPRRVVALLTDEKGDRARKSSRVEK